MKMDNSINKVILVGRVGKDPDIKEFENGRKFAHFSIATNNNYTDREGVEHEHTDWHKITVKHDGTAKFVEGSVKRGMLVYIEGRLHYYKYTGKDGIEKYVTEIVLQGYDYKLRIMDWGNNPKIIDAPQSSPKPASDSIEPDTETTGTDDDIDDDIPF